MHFLLLLFLALSLSACFGPRVHPNPSNPIYTVAVLPPYNATNDIDGPEMIRELVAERLQKWYFYSPKPQTEVDQLLRDQMGITLGEQLDLATPQKIGETLGVDGLLYIYVLNFDDKITGIYNVKKVRAGIKLVDVKTGQTVWSYGQGVKGEVSTGGLIGKAVAAAANVMDKREGLEEFSTIKGITEIPNLKEWKLLYHQDQSFQDMLITTVVSKVAGKALKMHLKPESNAMLDIIFVSMPAGPGFSSHPAPAPPPATAAPAETKPAEPASQPGTTEVKPSAPAEAPVAK